MEETKTTKRAEQVNAPFNPLRNERIKVEFVPQRVGFAPNDPKHVMYGGKMEGTGDVFNVPVLRTTGNYKNILTNDEKNFLEEALGLEKNALSVYNREHNFWDDYAVRVTKEGISLDLSNPEDYIRYKVLLANSDFICPSRQSLEDNYKATYRYVLVQDGEDVNLENSKMDTMMKCYKEFGKIDKDIDTMRVLVELLEGRPYGENTKAEFLKSRINTLIQADAKKFLRSATDPMLHAKVLIRRGTELGKLTKRGDFYYLKSDNSPLCGPNEDPTLSVAAQYLNLPAHQDVKFLLESALGDAKK